MTTQAMQEPPEYMYKHVLEIIYVEPHHFFKIAAQYHEMDARCDFLMLRAAVTANRTLVFTPEVCASVPHDILLFCLDDVRVWETILKGDTAYLTEEFQSKNPGTARLINVMRDLDMDAQSAYTMYKSGAHEHCKIVAVPPPNTLVQP